MTNHGHMYARGNGATEKGSPNMHSIFNIYEIKSPPILIRHLLPFSAIRGEVADIRVEIETKDKISYQPRAYYESRGNGATEKKGAQICTSIFLNVILIKSTPVLS